VATAVAVKVWPEFTVDAERLRVTEGAVLTVTVQDPEHEAKKRERPKKANPLTTMENALFIRFT
jgi:hypothetical protein